ncbi:MAG: hypothetical protein Q4E67_05165 [Planctomycetia bacterium]|nr:hypothetical protein [Planctomycetia bacterium]
MEEYPLTIFEEYMFRDDTPAYPMDSFRRLSFRGKLRKEAFQKALEETWEQHPLVLCRVRKKVGGGWVWTPAEKKPVVEWKKATPEDFNESGFPWVTPLSLTQEAGLRVLVLEQDEPSETQVLFQFHHSTSDGIGEMQFLSDWLLAYGIYTGILPKETPRRQLDATALRKRGTYGWGIRRYLKFFPDIFKTGNRLIYRSPIPLFPHRVISTQIPAGKYPYIRFLEFSREKTAYYLRQAKENGVTLNDLVLRDLFLTIDQWRKENGWERLDGWTRLTMPMNIRVAWHEEMPAANAVSFVFLDRRKRDLQDAGQLLREIHQETEWIKTHDQRYVFLLSLKACKYLLGGMRWMLKSRKCRSTCVVSNLGRVLENLPFPRNAVGNYELGSAELYQVDAAPPIRPRSLLSFSVLTYGSRLRLCLRYDEHFLSLSQADEILETFARSR